MAKLSNHEQLPTEYCSNVINPLTSAAVTVGGVSNNSTTFPSNHHLLVKHSCDAHATPLISSTSIGLQPTHSQHQLPSGNSFELNGVTTSSLSEDSGLPLTTNSSISSGDSTRMGLCKFEFEVTQYATNIKI